MLSRWERCVGEVEEGWTVVMRSWLLSAVVVEGPSCEVEEVGWRREGLEEAREASVCEGAEGTLLLEVALRVDEVCWLDDCCC